MELLGLSIKAVLMIGLWGLCARMVYLNERDRPPHEQIADLHTVQFLALIWPIWLVGLFLSIAGVLVFRLLRLPFKLHKALRT